MPASRNQRLIYIDHPRHAVLTNILLRHVGKDQSPLGLVILQAQTVADHLIHRGDSRSTSNGDTVSEFVGLVGVFGDWAFEGEGLAGFEVGDVLGHFSGLSI